MLIRAKGKKGWRKVVFLVEKERLKSEIIFNFGLFLGIGVEVSEFVF